MTNVWIFDLFSVNYCFLLSVQSPAGHLIGWMGVPS